MNWALKTSALAAILAILTINGGSHAQQGLTVAGQIDQGHESFEANCAICHDSSLQGFARCGQRHTASGSVEQAHAQPLFESTKRMTQRRCTDPKLKSRFPEAPMLGEFQEVRKISELRSPKLHARFLRQAISPDQDRAQLEAVPLARPFSTLTSITEPRAAPFRGRSEAIDARKRFISSLASLTRGRTH